MNVQCEQSESYPGFSAIRPRRADGKNMTRRLVLAAILLVSLTIRLFFAITCEAIPDYSDMAVYNDAALAEGVPSYPPPGYPLFLRAIYSAFGPLNYKAVFIVQALLSAMVVFLIYFTARRVCGEIAGLSAAMIAALYPNLIVYNLTTLTESVSVALVMAMLAVSVSSLSGKKKPVIAGIVLAAGYFVKPSILFFFPGLFVGMKKRFVLAATLAAILVPVFIYGGLTGTGEDRAPRLLYKAYNPLAAKTSTFSIEETEAGESASAEEYLGSTLDFIRSNKWLTLDLIYQKASLLVSKGWDSFVLKDISRDNRHMVNILIYAYLPVMLFGLTGMIRFSDPRNRIIWFMAVSYLAIHIILTIFKLRYRLLVEPMLIIYCGILIEKIFRLRGRGSEEGFQT